MHSMPMHHTQICCTRCQFCMTLLPHIRNRSAFFLPHGAQTQLGRQLLEETVYACMHRRTKNTIRTAKTYIKQKLTPLRICADQYLRLSLRMGVNISPHTHTHYIDVRVEGVTTSNGTQQRKARVLQSYIDIVHKSIVAMHLHTDTYTEGM